MSVVNINRVVLTGRLTSDPELRFLPSGCGVCAFNLEVHRRRQDPETGAWGERILFFNVVAFGGLGESSAKYLRAGRQVAVEGWLDMRTSENATGDCTDAVSIVADTVQFIGAPPESVLEERSGSREHTGALELAAA